MSESDIAKLIEIVNEIKSNPDYSYQESHYIKDRFDPKRLKYFDIIIDGINYEIDALDNILSELRMLMNIELSHKLVLDSYNSLLK